MAQYLCGGEAFSDTMNIGRLGTHCREFGSLSRPRNIFLPLLVLALVALLNSKSALAYVATKPRWPADVACTGAACNDQPFTIRYSYGNMFDGGMHMPDGSPLPNLLIRESIEEALGVWASAIPVNFIEVPYPKPADLRFQHYRIDGPDPASGPLKIKALSACVGFDKFCDISFDDGDPWQEVGQLAKPDVLGAAIHEVGHFLGLDHSGDPQANMYPTFHRTAGLGTGQLFPDDVAGIHYLYGSGTGSVTPAGVPEPATGVVSTCLLAAFAFSRLRRRPSQLSGSVRRTS
jgi:hypothetical protein